MTRLKHCEVGGLEVPLDDLDGLGAVEDGQPRAEALALLSRVLELDVGVVEHSVTLFCNSGD